MKKIILFSGLIFCFLRASGQETKDELKKMIDSAIAIKYSLLIKANKNGSNNDYINNLYLIDQQNNPISYLDKSSKFKYIEIYDRRNRKTMKSGIYAWKVFTVLNGDELVITIVDFYITYMKHNYNFSNSGGSKTIFKYSCTENGWKLVDSKYKGN